MYYISFILFFRGKGGCYRIFAIASQQQPCGSNLNIKFS